MASTRRAAMTPVTLVLMTSATTVWPFPFVSIRYHTPNTLLTGVSPRSLATKGLTWQDIHAVTPSWVSRRPISISCVLGGGPAIDAST
jgi:hypothetical protein